MYGWMDSCCCMDGGLMSGSAWMMDGWVGSAWMDGWMD